MIIAKSVLVIEKNGLTTEYTNVTQIHTVGNHLTICGDIQEDSLVNRRLIIKLDKMVVEFEVS